MSENKAYFAVIPANVRYSTEISNGAKLLYAEITALSNERGYCWASNDYFAGLYNTSPRTISRWLAELGREGFIYSLVDNAKGNTRQIWLPEMAASHAKNVNSLTTKMSIGIDKNVVRSRQKRREGIDKNVIQNTTVNNKENNTVKVSANAPNDLPKAGVENLDVEAEPFKKSRSAAPAAAAVPVPAPLCDSVDFMSAWAILVDTKKWRKKSADAVALSLKKLAAFDAAFATELVQAAIIGEYQGVVFQDTADKYAKWQKANGLAAPQPTVTGPRLTNVRTYGN